MHINTVGLGNPIKRTCATCHGMHMTGMDTANGWMDVGTTNNPWALEPPESPWATKRPALPLFKITCRADLPPHPFLGRVDLHAGSGTRADFRQMRRRGDHRDPAVPRARRARAVLLQWLRRTLRELVDFYDRRFNIASRSRRGPIWSTSWACCDARHDARMLGAWRLGPALAAAAPPPGTRHQLRELPHPARYALGALLAQRLRVRPLLPDDPERRERRGAAAADGPPGAGRGHGLGGAAICGGIVLLRCACRPCRSSTRTAPQLPADDRYPIDFNPRPPGPSGGRLAFAPDPPAPARRAAGGPRDRRPSTSISTSTRACRFAIPHAFLDSRARTSLERRAAHHGRARRAPSQRRPLLEESRPVAPRRGDRRAARGRWSGGADVRGLD